MAVHITAPETRDSRHAGDTALIAQLQGIHRELREKLAGAAQIPTGESYETALVRLSSDIDALAQRFLRLAGELLDGGSAIAEPELGTEIPC